MLLQLLLSPKNTGSPDDSSQDKLGPPFTCLWWLIIDSLAPLKKISELT